jgi:hypothetical protein
LRADPGSPPAIGFLIPGRSVACGETTTCVNSARALRAGLCSRARGRRQNLREIITSIITAWEQTPVTTRSSTAPLTRALIAALEQTGPGADIPHIARIVEALIGRAVGGDLSAIREIFDRVDGKAPAGAARVETEEPRKVIYEWKS